MADGCVTWWGQRITVTFSLMSSFRLIQKVLLDGVLILMVSILLSVLAVLLLVEALICSLLMIPTQNRMLSRAVRTYLSQHGSGFNQVQSND